MLTRREIGVAFIGRDIGLQKHTVGSLRVDYLRDLLGVLFRVWGEGIPRGLVVAGMWVRFWEVEEYEKFFFIIMNTEFEFFLFFNSLC